MRAFLVSGFALAALGVATSLRAQEDTVLVEAVFRVDIDRGPSEILLATAADSRLLLPLRRILDLVEVGTAEVVAGRSITAVLQPANRLVKFDTENLTLTVGDSVFPLGRWDVVWRDGELFVYTGTLMRALGVEVGVDWEALIAVVGNTDALPVARRARRERRRVLLSRRAPPLLRSVPAPVKDRVADGAVLEWALSGATDALITNSTAQIGLGAKLFGGGLAAEYERLGFSGGSITRTRGSWQRAWPERRWLRQVRIGDVQTSGLRSRIVRGAVVTNQPFIRSSAFDFEEIVGELPEGWEIELYDAYGLLDFGEADPFGEFRVALPLRYGQNPFDMVLYGPQGEVVRRRRTIRVPFSRIPAGALEYSVGIGACRANDPCGGLVSADARYGINNHVTAQVGWDVITRGGDASDVFQPYAAVSAAVLPSVRLTTEAVVNGQLRAQADFEPSPDLRVQLAQTFLDTEGARLTGTPQDRRRTDGSLQWITTGRVTTVLQASAGRASGDGISRAAYSVTGTARYGGGRFALGFRQLRVTQPSLSLTTTSLDLNGDFVMLRGPRWLRTATLGGGIGVDVERGISTLRAAIGRAVGRVVRVDFGVGWFRNQGGFAIELGLSSMLPGPRFGSRNRFTAGTGAEGVQYFDGSVLFDPNTRRAKLGDGRDVGRAGLSATVFLDVDGDGERDDDEPGLVDVPVRVDGWTLDTDSAGRFSTWELFPFETSFITVDTTGFANPFYVVPNRILEVTPTPNSFVSVEIPVVVGAEVSGGVLYHGRPLVGVRVELRELNTGRVISLTTFTDGGFYVMGVPPGNWVASIPRSVLDGIGARSAPVRFTVPVGREEKTVEALVLTVENGNGR